MKSKTDNFDEYARNYRDLHNDNIRLTGMNSRFFALRKVLEVLRFEKHQQGSLLDIGCGDGTTEEYFCELFPSWSFTAIDVSGESLAVADAKQLPRTVFTVFDGENINYPDENFDVVFMAGVLHHVDSKVGIRLINEATRLLRKGGRLYIFEHNPLNPFTRYLVRTCVFDEHVKLLPSWKIKNLLIKNGLEQVQTRFTSFFPNRAIFRLLLPFEDKLSWLPIGAQYYLRAVK